MEVILYSDFNCPFCYALNERIHAAGVAEQVQWRGVQHAPQLPIPMAPADPYLRAELQDEVSAIRRLAPEMAIEIPRGKPNTGAVIAAVAAAVVTDPAAAHSFKDSLYRSFWRQGADLSDSKVLHELAREAGLPQHGFAHNVDATVAKWQDDWMKSGFRGVPAMLRSDGQRLEGLVSQQVLQAFVQG
ncbi:MAG: DsbA family protein [Gammaproteobacteria bacterium]